MKLVNKEIVFESHVCWSCNGEKEVSQGISCPLYWKPVNKYPDRKCPHCGAKNKNSHGLIGSKIVTCGNCDGKGEKMEDKYSSMPKEIFDSFEFKIGYAKGCAPVAESVFGIGLVGGCTDYGKMSRFYIKNGIEETIKKVREDNYGGRQVLNFLERESGRLCDYIMIVLRENDYSLYPIWK